MKATLTYRAVTEGVISQLALKELGHSISLLKESNLKILRVYYEKHQSDNNSHKGTRMVKNRKD